MSDESLYTPRYIEIEKLYVSPGGWAGHPRALTGQDAVIMRK